MSEVKKKRERADETNRRIKSRCEELEDENKTLRKEMAEMEAAAAEIEKNRKIQERLEQENNELKDRLAEIRSTLDAEKRTDGEQPRFTGPQTSRTPSFSGQKKSNKPVPCELCGAPSLTVPTVQFTPGFRVHRKQYLCLSCLRN